MNNLPALVVALPFVSKPGNCSLWPVLLGVNAGPSLLVTGSLASLLWVESMAQLGVPVRARQYLGMGLRVSLPAAAALATLGRHLPRRVLPLTRVPVASVAVEIGLEDQETQVSDATTDHTHVASNGKAELSLDELAAIQPGMARLMVEVSDRMWKCYHAGAARNRPLARYQLSEATKIMKTSVVVRPKYDEAMRDFIGGELAALRAVIEAEEWDRFEDSFADVVAASNRYHEEFDKGFLVWKVPEAPPADLDLRPR